MSIEADDSNESLTAPTLNSIYESTNLLDENDINNNIYQDLDKEIATIKKTSTVKPTIKNKQFFFQIFGKIFILGLTGILFVKLSENIYENSLINNKQQVSLVDKPFILVTNLINKIFGVSKISIDYVGFLFGVVLGIIQPVLDSILPKFFNRKLFRLTSKPSIDTNTVEFSGVIRSSIVLLGISFGVRNINWETDLQASIAFSLLNVCVWLLLDSTLSGFFGGTLLAILSTGFVLIFDDFDFKSFDVNSFAENSELTANNLFIASFFFCSLLIYGKLGRFLFN